MTWVIADSLVRFYLSLVLGVAGLAKLTNPTPASAFLTDIGLGSDSGSRQTVIRVVSVLEIALGGLFVWGLYPALTGGFVAVLFIGFTWVNLVAHRRKVSSDCGCFGKIGVSVPLERVGVNLFLFALTSADVAVITPLATESLTQPVGLGRAVIYVVVVAVLGTFGFWGRRSSLELRAMDGSAKVT